MTSLLAKLFTCLRSGFLLVAAALTLASFHAAAVDLNTATAEQLQTVSGIGPKTAELIIEERERGGRFAADRVRGIGPKRLESLQAGGASVSAPATAPSTAPVSQPAAAAPAAAP